MTSRVIPAIYENGVLKPLEPLDLVDQQTVYITVATAGEESDEDPLEAWHSVYADLSEEEVTEIEAIALQRDNFMSQLAKE